jgi:hypothetical protein
MTIHCSPSRFNGLLNLSELSLAWFESYLSGHAATFDFGRLFSSTLKGGTALNCDRYWNRRGLLCVSVSTSFRRIWRDCNRAMRSSRTSSTRTLSRWVIRFIDALALFAQWLDQSARDH